MRSLEFIEIINKWEENAGGHKISVSFLEPPCTLTSQSESCEESSNDISMGSTHRRWLCRPQKRAL